MRTFRLKTLALASRALLLAVAAGIIIAIKTGC